MTRRRGDAGTRRGTLLNSSKATVHEQGPLKSSRRAKILTVGSAEVRSVGAARIGLGACAAVAPLEDAEVIVVHVAVGIQVRVDMAACFCNEHALGWKVGRIVRPPPTGCAEDESIGDPPGLHGRCGRNRPKRADTPRCPPCSSCCHSRTHRRARSSPGIVVGHRVSVA